jgi:CheY-like chemotaxis protein
MPPDQTHSVPLRVLVADDEPSLRMAISLYLRRRGHIVTEAADAHEALELAHQQKFDAALIDARMPGDGLRLLDRLDETHLRGRTALMSGDAGRSRTADDAAGGRPYLLKPFDMQAAVTLIESLAVTPDARTADTRVDDADG